MSEREDYLVTKVINDKFIALDNRNRLTAWSIPTGKFYVENSEPFNIPQDYSNFEVYSFDKTNHAYS